MVTKRVFMGLLIVVLALSALVFAPLTGAQEGGVPYWPTNGWQTSTPEKQGMDSAKLVEFLKNAKLGRGFHSALVIRHGYVVLDASTYPFTPDQPHALFSVTKSIVSTLVGIAIDKGFIQNVDQSIWDFFPKDQVANMDERKAAITLKNLMTHSSGLGLTSENDLKMYTLTANDQSWVKYVLDQRMNAAPGARFNYLDANAHLVSAIISKATGQSAFEFAQPNLFDPLGITDATWIADPQGVSQGGDHSYLSPYDMAKLGYLFLHNGEWDGQQVVPSARVKEATSQQIPQSAFWEGYGYFWWTGTFGSGEDKHMGYVALGLGGQEIWVIPDFDMIIVVTGDLTFFGNLGITRYILPAVQSDTALPDNPEALTNLTSEVESLAHPIPAAVKPLPEMAQRISGKVYALKENNLGWQSMSLTFGDQEATLTLDAQDRHLELPVGLDGIVRVSSVGLPPEPVWRPLDNVALALEGSWSTTSPSTFVVNMRDVRGMMDFELQMKTFGEDGVMIAVNTRLGWWAPVTILGTVQ